MPNEEKKEIENIYRAKGFEGDQLNNIVEKITSNKDVWLKTMLTNSNRKPSFGATNQTLKNSNSHPL